MIEMQRGEIRNRARAAQVKNFAGLRFGNITPTDIDGLIDYKNIAYILIETKSVNAPEPHGQMLALERLCDDLQWIKPTILIIAVHDTPSYGDIDVAGATAAKFRYNGKWRNDDCTVRELIERFLERNRLGIK